MAKRKTSAPVDPEQVEIERLTAIYQGLPPKQFALAQGLIIQAARLRVRLDKLWAELTEKVKNALEKKELGKIPALLNRNFDLRLEVCRTSISAMNRKMVELARSAGASAKFTGSGGAIIGTYEDEAMFQRLTAVCKEHGIEVVKPAIVTEGVL